MLLPKLCPLADALSSFEPSPFIVVKAPPSNEICTSHEVKSRFEPVTHTPPAFAPEKGPLVATVELIL